ncbi:hypothetical protein CAPTEDRAFT_221667 [Capitella teleta]|uniref:Transcription initiation factor TFIID subunit 2 n=1 Tax=Capitella teleta TaxID=283909 RepID=R7TJ58_CAPTE|nr:hypothetical protein CAPTEDRAFT_221667 [Capitella teleta]|eukprot:ELT93532.1 hypothetical protein CAPTEDRAFT_221667 [Capitella teleta]
MSKSKKDGRLSDAARPFRIAHQTLCITGFNFETESMVGYVEMQVHPLRPDLKKVKFNSKHYNDPTLEICQEDGKQRNLDFFENCHYSAMTAVDSDHGNGELAVKLPAEALAIVQEMKMIRICIEFSLEQPRGGVKFVVPDLDGTMLDRGAHLFTYGHENSSRLWFPCVDSYTELCTWKLEFSVDMYMTAVSCGDLIETVYTADLRKKTYHYYLSAPTAAPNIALAVGPFEVFVDPYMHEVTHFCLPHLLPLLKQTTSQLHEAFEFYEELLSCRYPYTCYKQVFVDMAFDEAMPYATLTLFSTNLLHTKNIIDQIPITRQHMANGIAAQFFKCFISMNSWYDCWLPKGITGYLGGLYRRKAFGNNEYRHWVGQELEAVRAYENEVGPIVLDPSVSKETPALYFSIYHPHTISPRYADIYARKAALIIRMLELRLGRELLLQVLNKLLAVATQVAQQKFYLGTWYNMLLSTPAKAISTVTGKDIQPFIQEWVQQGGHARFFGQFVFNRKRNIIELELKQEWTTKGALRYVGPLTVVLQELDGTFNHTFKIEENKTKFEITCHSKSRRHKKKKIPLCTGEEIDMDLGDTDADSPVLWMRIDPEMFILRSVQLEQPDFMWQYLLRYERCVVSQCQAITALTNYPTPKTRLALTDTIESDQCFYRVRIAAAEGLVKVANSMVGSWAGPPAMMTIFRKLFGSHSCPTIVRQNHFNNFQHYFLQKAIPGLMAGLRTVHGICPPDVHGFILDLFKYNDNSKNKYSDNYYRAALIDAVAETITPAVTMVTVTGMCPSTDSLTPDTSLILEELTRYLNLEKLLPCYRLVITVSCLKAIRKLQKFGHLPSDAAIFRSYAEQGNFLDVRLAALEALVDFTKVEGSFEIWQWLLEVIEEDPEPYIRHCLIQMICKNPPFQRKEDSSLSTPALVEKLWKLMNSGFSHDSRLRCDIADLYFTLYGRTRPACLPIPESMMVLNLKEKRTKFNPCVMPDDFMEDDEDEDLNISVGSNEHKRRADSPLHSDPSEFNMRSSLDQNMTVSNASQDDSQFKFKIRINSPEMKSEPSKTSFANEFARFTSKDSLVLDQNPPASLLDHPLDTSIHKRQEDDFVARLSEDSSVGSPVLIQEETVIETVVESMDYDSQMYASADNTPQVMTPSVHSSAPPTPLAEDGVHKAHKAKKKKKKNKHKKRHKHDKERGDRPRDALDSDSLASPPDFEVI